MRVEVATFLPPPRFYLPNQIFDVVALPFDLAESPHRSPVERGTRDRQNIDQQVVLDSGIHAPFALSVDVQCETWELPGLNVGAYDPCSLPRLHFRKCHQESGWQRK